VALESTLNRGFPGLDQFGLLRLLREGECLHRVGSLRDDSIAIDAVLPRQRWEIEFFLDDEPAVEVFKSDGKVLGADALPGLIAKWSEVPPPAGLPLVPVDQSSLLRRLREAEICFLVDELRIRRMMVAGSIMVEAFLPGELWEIDLLESGEIEIERFETTYVRTFDADALRELFSMVADRQTSLRTRKASRKLAHQIQ
jgi:hypothetical protein